MTDSYVVTNNYTTGIVPSTTAALYYNMNVYVYVLLVLLQSISQSRVYSKIHLSIIVNEILL